MEPRTNRSLARLLFAIAISLHFTHRNASNANCSEQALFSTFPGHLWSHLKGQAMQLRIKRTGSVFDNPL